MRDSEKQEKQKYTKIASLLREGMPLHLVRTSFNEALVFLCKIVRVDETSFFISSPKRGTVEAPLKDTEVVLLSYFGPDAVYQLETDVVQSSEHKNETVFELKLPKMGWRLQRRNFFRVQLGIAAKCRAVTEETDGNSHRLDVTGKWHECLIHNLSSGGALIFSDELFDIDGYFEILFELPLESGPAIYQEIIKVVRVNQAKDGDRYGKFLYRYGGYFFTMEDRERSNLTRFLFERQLEKGRPLI